jgi:hypothetical protein
MLGGSFGDLPGMIDTSPYITYENAFGWGGFPRLALIIGKQISSSTIDAGATPTWRLRPGLVLGQISATGLFIQYDPTASDGSGVARGVLIEGMRMQDVFSGSNVAKFLGVMVSGPVRASALYGLDNKARYDMRAAGFVFDDDPRGPVEWFQLEGAFGNTTTVIPTPAVGSAYPNATHFVVISGTGTATFTLPAIAPGLRYKFTQYMDQTLTVQATTAILVGDGSQTYTSASNQTSSHKIGGTLMARSIYVGSSTYKWLITTESLNTITWA